MSSDPQGPGGIASDFLTDLETYHEALALPVPPIVPVLGLVPGRAETRGRPRSHFPDRPATNQELKAHARSTRLVNRKECIAVLDMETDPFDNVGRDQIKPFCACLYSDNFEPIIIWEENRDAFCEAVLQAIMDLPEPYTIYAHNGGKFDYLFLIHKLRGKVSFKGRGIMSCRVGPHELRDSFHIIPERLANYHKEEFDYQKMTKAARGKHRDEILRYLISDCKYSLEIIKAFIERFGFKLSIGQAAMSGMQKTYPGMGRLGEKVDATLRTYFFGGRVECLAGAGHFKGPYKLFDVNSMYPDAMANNKHPIGNHYIKRVGEGIGPFTFFIELSCRNFGALVKRDEAHDNETSANVRSGRFFTTIWEYKAALELGLIDRVEIHSVIDCEQTSDFSKFIIPLYDEKARLKDEIDALKKSGDETSQRFFEAKRDYTLSKLVQNNSYGKFAQNPRNYKEHFITEPDAAPPEGFEDQLEPSFRNAEYAIWEKPSPVKGFNNVGTAASITGAARAKLLRAINGAVDPIYCDTDSLICRSISGVDLHPSRLGAWDLEAEFSEVIICGKKLYACKPKDWNGDLKKIKVRSKGAGGLQWADYEAMLREEVVATVNSGPTLTKTGRQFYMVRNIRRTAPLSDAHPRNRKVKSNGANYGT